MSFSRSTMVPVFAVAVVMVSACGGAAAARDNAVPETTADAALQANAKISSTDPKVNPHAAALADFKTRVDQYAALHKRLAKGDSAQQENSDPARINAAKASLASKVRAARVNAKQGDIFTPAVRPVFRRLLAPELKGADGRDAKAILKDDAPAPGSVPFKVNAGFPQDQPLPSVPANLLLALPTLPAPLEYRIVGQHLILLDTASDLIVDYILNAITT
jgi:hypothetical protein